MKKSTAAWLGFALLLVIGGGAATWSSRPAGQNSTDSATLPVAEKTIRRPAVSSRPAPGPGPALTEVDRRARADKIRRDYDEMTGKFSADYAAAGNAFPGGLNAYLRQLAFLEREKHQDLATILTPRELEDLEMHDSNAGQAVQKLLGDTAATDEQRRATFRLHKEFDDQFALTFDPSPSALAAREAARQAAQQKVREVLGDVLFGSWLRGEGPDYAAFAAFGQQQGLAANTALDLWRLKSDFLLARLQLKARADLAPAQQADTERLLVTQTLTRVTGLIGPAAVAGAGRDLLTWLPRLPAK